MITKKTIFIFTLCVSVLLNCFLAFWAVNNFMQLAKDQEIKQFRAKDVAFARMFIEDVLMAKSDIDFDTRLTLETSVRNLNDTEILAQWQKFTKAQDKDQAGLAAKGLLDLLVKKTAD